MFSSDQEMAPPPPPLLQNRLARAGRVEDGVQDQEISTFQAFKFFMEQLVEYVVKYYYDRSLVLMKRTKNCT